MPANERRGGPLVALCVLLGAWVLARVAFFGGPAYWVNAEPARYFANIDHQAADTEKAERHDLAARGMDAKHAAQSAPGAQRGEASRPHVPLHTGAARYSWLRSNPVEASQPAAPARRFVPFAPASRPDESGREAIARPTRGPVPAHIAAGHQMLWMAALAKMPFPMAGLASGEAPPFPVPFYAAGREPVSDKRWSADGWMLLRRGGSSSFATGAAPVTYGASQAGAVLRYRLQPGNPRKPTAYLRATSALGSTGDNDIALGISARPIPSIPVIAAAEMRATNQQEQTRLRPAAMIVTELAPFDLPMGTRGEFYAQAGYVGGQFDTAFADGQLRIDRQVTHLGNSEVRAGGGGWAGAQKGASRVDIGPVATFGLPLGKSASARIGVDWRFRISGNALPKSGPAVTLSAGF